MATVTGSKRQLTHTSNTYESNGDVTIGGNLNINGTTTTIDTANLLVEDKNIIIGDVASPTNTTADGGGITLKGATDKTINWVNSTSSWTSNQTFSAPNLTLTSLTTSSETTALLINGSNQVVKRTLGSNAFNSTSFLTSYTETDTLATVTGRGRTTSTNGSSVWDTTTQGTTQGSLHLMSIGSDHAGGAITFDASDSNGAHAGIYVKSDGSYGTKMYLSTTDSYASGSKSAISINHQGYVNIVRGNDRLTVNGNTVWHAGNDGSGSGLDADLLDGNQASAFATASHTHANANSTSSGFMSDTHYDKLEGIADSADVTPSWVPSTNPNYLTGNQSITLSGAATGSGTTSISVSLAADSVGSAEIAANAVGASEIAASAVGASELNVSGNGTTTQFLRSDGDGTFTWATPPDTNTTYSVGDGGLTQKNFTTTLKNKLDGIAASANNYSLPLAASGTRGGVQIGYLENGKNYPVEVSSEKMFVNVPWTDTNTNTTYSAGNGLALSGTTFKIDDPVNLSQLTESTDATTDKILLWDESASLWKYMTMDDLQDAIDTNTTYSLSSFGITATSSELNFTDGVTSNIQTQLNGKQASGTYNTIIGTDSDINTSGSTIIDNIYVTDGVITSMGTRTLTLEDLGYTGATNANNYSLPAGSSSTRGGFKIGYLENGKNYPVEVSSEQMFVNVPWVDTNTNTTYSAGTGITLSGTTFSLTDTASKLNTSGGTLTGDLTIGDGSADTNLHIKKSDNNVSDHIVFYNGTTRVGEIGCHDTTWLRINQQTAKNIYTPRYIRADGGFFVDGATKGINGSGNFIGGTITGASDANVSNWDTAYGWGNHASAGYITGNQAITLSGDVSGSGTTSISVSLAADSVGSSEIADNAVTAAAIAANAVGASEIAASAVGASELNVSGNGTTAQFLRSDGDGTFTWATPTDTNTTYSAGTHLSLSGTTFNVDFATTDKVVNIGHNATTNNEGEIILDTSIAGSPQIGFTEHGDASWAIGIDDGDNSFKIHGNANTTIPTINNLSIPLFEVTTTAGTAYLNNNRIFHAGYHPNADTLTTARTISLGGDLSGSASFNGSSNITITAAVADDSHNHVISNVDGLQTALNGKLNLSGGTMSGNINFNDTDPFGVDSIGFNTHSDRHKIRLYNNNTSYCIGMQSGVRYGGLNDWAMTFQFNNETDRGFWWGDESHSVSQGAMALTTQGKLSVARTIRVGYGESDTSTPSDSYADYNIPIKHRVYTASTLPPASPAGQRAFISDSAYGLATAIGAVVSGGGSNTIPVYSDGSSWRAG